MGVYNLDKIFNPDSIAVVGASEKRESIGYAVMENLMQGGFEGTVVPVNPNYSKILGLEAYSAISEMAQPVDLAVIATPISSVSAIVKECVDVGVGGAIVISAGGRETGLLGRKLEEEIEKEARKGGLRVLGPNCMGIVCPQIKLNASFVAHMPYKGKLAFISQSGAICASMLDLSLKERIGFSYFVSIGSMMDVDFGDLIDYLGNDPEVESILLYIESLTNFRKFMSAARAVSRLKPIIILKSGRSDMGARAAASHTGAMAGEDVVYDAAFGRGGTVRVKTIEDFFDCAELLAKQPRPTGPRLVVITNSGGPGVMAADAIAEYGLELASLERGTFERLKRVLPPFWSHGNPVDILGDATVERYESAVSCCFEAQEADGMLVILNPASMTNPADVAASISHTLKQKPYPVFTAWMGGAEVEKGREILNSAGIPTYETPERAIRAFKYLYDYARNQEMLQEIPPRPSPSLRFEHDRARFIIEEGLRSPHGLITEESSRELLDACGIPVSPVKVAASVEEAIESARKMGYPVVMKIYSNDISHKTEANGVQLDLRSEMEVREAYQRIMQGAHAYNPQAKILGVTLQPMIQDPDVEILLGAKMDPNFGPVILLGMGGIYAEVVEDKAIGLPPLNRLLARMLMERTKVYRLLKGYRNRPPADLESIEEMMVQFSHLLVDFPEISELDMNPVIVKAGKPVVVDVRVFLKPFPRPSPYHLVISPYPEKYETPGVTTDGLKIMIRPIKPEDAPQLVGLFDSLSPTSIYYRFFGPMKALPHSMLARFTQIDYDREIAMVALEEGEDGEKMLGVARVIGDPDGKTGEFAIVVGDPWQGRGVGGKLLEHALRIAKERGLERLWGYVLAENKKMLNLARKFGFQVSRGENFSQYEVSIDPRSCQFEP
jgi:acetyltransferase